MSSASTRIRRVALALWTGLAAYLVAPASRALPATGLAAAEAEGLGAGGAITAYNYVFAVSIILAFIFGFAIRDAIHRHAIRAKAKSAAKAVPKRA